MPLPQEALPDFAAVYRANYGFVWRTIRHLGVDPARIDDAVQDTFLVVYRRLPEFAGRAAVRTWLFEIARRIASRYRRSAAREEPRRIALSEAEVLAPAVDAPVEQAEAAAILQGFLDGLDRDQAVVFVMTELEQWQAPEIAAELGVNLNTVYSRLRAARRELDRMVRRLDARDRRARPRQGAHVLAALVMVGPPWPPPWRLAAARDPAVIADMLAKTWSMSHVATPAAIAGGSPVVGLSVASAGLFAVLAFGRPAAPPEPPPSVVAAAHETAPVQPQPPPQSVALAAAATPIPPDSAPAAPPRPRDAWPLAARSPRWPPSSPSSSRSAPPCSPPTTAPPSSWSPATSGASPPACSLRRPPPPPSRPAAASANTTAPAATPPLSSPAGPPPPWPRGCPRCAARERGARPTCPSRPVHSYPVSRDIFLAPRKPVPPDISSHHRPRRDLAVHVPTDSSRSLLPLHLPPEPRLHEDRRVRGDGVKRGRDVQPTRRRSPARAGERAVTLAETSPAAASTTRRSANGTRGPQALTR
ncbi:RNA polymerase sigma factor [Nannocystis pusilla]|uniref:RNA polymerase sigma factor n=1 Tax=Nannocystis pusilla TaxID=889268 RepID=UPI003B767AFF